MNVQAVSDAVSEVGALIADASFTSMHARAVSYAPLFRLMVVEMGIEVGVDTNALVTARYGESVASTVCIAQPPNMRAVNKAYADIRVRSVSNDLEDALFNICVEYRVLSMLKNQDIPKHTQPLLGFVQTTRAAARMLDGVHAERLIGTLDMLQKAVENGGNLFGMKSFFNAGGIYRAYMEFEKAYAGLAFARGGVAPVTTRVSALLDTVALFQEQSFVEHVAQPSGGQAGIPPVEISKKLKGILGPIQTQVDPNYNPKK